MKSINYRLVFLFLLLLITIGFLLRTAFFPDKLFFGYEQGRDALVVRDLLNGKLTLLGPKTDIEGLFHGVLYYYLIAIPYFLGQGNPVVVSYFLIFFSCLGIPLIFFLGKTIFNFRVGIIAAVFYAVSYGAITYSRWMANPVLTPLFVMIAILSTLKLNKDGRFLIILTASLGIIIHFEIVAAIFLLPVILIYLLSNNPKRPKIKYPILSLAVFLIFLSSYFLFEIRHQFLQVNAFISFINDFSNNKSFSPEIAKIFRFYIDEFTIFVTPFFNFGGVLLILGFFLLRNKILWLWLVTTPLLMLLFSRFALSHLFIVLGPAFIILTSSLVDYFWQKKIFLGIILMFSIIFLNLFSLFKFLPENRKVFFQAGQELFNYQDMLKTIDFIYQDRNGQNFSIHPFTIPYFSDHAWRYLFSWYGFKKYNYLPLELGSKSFYIIYQPSYGQPWFLADWLKEENLKGKLLEVKKFGIITVEKREVK